MFDLNLRKPSNFFIPGIVCIFLRRHKEATKTKLRGERKGGYWILDSVVQGHRFVDVD